MGSTVLAIGLAQIIGWGASFNLPGVLGPSIARSFETSLDVILLGPTVMLTVLALCSWWMAPVLERHGARTAMMIGAVVMALGLTIITLAPVVQVYLAAWVLVGIGGAAALSTPAQVALKEIFDDRARQAIGMMSLVSGLGNTILWPILSRMDGAFGWRWAAGTLAVALVVVYIPIIALTGARRPPPTAPATPVETPAPEPLDPMRFALVAAVTALNGFITWGFSLTLIPLLTQKGLETSTAVTLASALGIVTIGARLIEVLGALTPLHSAIVSTVTMLFSFVLLSMGGSLAIAITFILLYGFAGGLMSVVRATLPLTIFPPTAYARAAAKLALPLNLSFAAAPPVFAALLESRGANSALALSIALGVLATISVLALTLLVRRQDRAAGMTVR